MKATRFMLMPILIWIGISACTSPEKQAPEIERGLVGEQAMVVSAHPLASEVGKQILLQGGNAADAAVAVQFALAVVFPAAGNIAGGGFAVWRSADGTTLSLDFREKAPLLGGRDMYLDSNGEVMEGMSTAGHRAAGVPGSVDGMVKLHEKLGSLPWEQLVQPAIDLAEKGFLLTAREARGLNSVKESLAEYSTVNPLFLTGKDWAEGDTIYWKDLATTLTHIRDKGRSGFYEGAVADLIVAEMERGGGLISHEDLESYSSQWRDPIQFTYKDYEITSMAPPSSGGIALAGLMHIVASYPLQEMGFGSTDYIHLLSEAERRVYADRAEFLGDPDFVAIPQKGLLNPNYAKDRMSNFQTDKATPSDEIGPGMPSAYESDETTHFSIVDPSGNAISITTTINGGYGNRVVVDGAGFVLNNEMDDFSIKPGFPNMFGLVGGEANAIAPGKRMLSSMTPSIVSRNGKLLMVVGTPGGSTIITSVFQTILNVIEHGMGMQEAVSAPRFHHQWLPDMIQYETALLDSLGMEALQQRGHQLRDRGNIGRVDAILVLPDGKLEGGADPRGDDAAAGY
jgi:gamma-glutamyltranspeptidase/glutathione hydrolase